MLHSVGEHARWVESSNLVGALGELNLSEIKSLVLDCSNFEKDIDNIENTKRVIVLRSRVSQKHCYLHFITMGKSAKNLISSKLLTGGSS